MSPLEIKLRSYQQLMNFIESYQQFALTLCIYVNN